MRHPKPYPALAALLSVLVAALLLPACSGNSNPSQASEQLKFGVDMARRELWSEAMFRFQEAARLDPQNPHILNNLAVASEALGQFDQALDYYKRALQLAPNDREARANYSRFAEFYQSFKAPKSKPKTAPGATAPGAAAAPGAPAPEPSLPVTPPGQAPVQPPTPPTGNVASPPIEETPPAAPPPPGGSPATPATPATPANG